MIAELGYGTIFITFCLAIYGILSTIICRLRHQQKWVNSARAALQLMFPLLTLSIFFLLVLLVEDHYEVSYVYQVSNESMPVYLKLTALWGGQSGSLLFWSWVLSIFAFAVMARSWDEEKELLPWVIFTILVVLSFFIGLSLFYENPFIRFWQLTNGAQVTAMFKPAGAVLLSPSDGNGLNPLLRHPGMILHPPMLYMGFTAFVIPYAFAIAALITGKREDHWLRRSRSWTILAWLFLSAGLLLGSRWAYDVLGWGGYWGWDPVENAAFMPWLLSTTLIHSLMVQEKRGLFKRWNMILILLTFSMVIYGTFLTRSGVLTSVHAFAESSIGPAFFIFIGIMFIGTMTLVMLRWGRLSTGSHIYSFFSRESLFILNNLLFFGIFFVIFLGVNFPIFSELITGQKMTVGPRWYEQTTGPLFAALLFLMAVAPLSAWGYSTAKTMLKTIWIPLVLSFTGAVIAYFWSEANWTAVIGYWLVVFTLFTAAFDLVSAALSRKKQKEDTLFHSFLRTLLLHRRKYAAYFVHISIALITMGILGMEIFQSETQATMAIGEQATLGKFTVTLASIDEFDINDGRNITRAVLDVQDNGRFVSEIYPRRDYYYKAQQAVTIPGVYSSIFNDVYVVLVDWEPINSNQATFKIYRNVMINWLWIGGIGLIISGILAGKPIRQRTRPIAV